MMSACITHLLPLVLFLRCPKIFTLSITAERLSGVSNGMHEPFSGKCYPTGCYLPK